MGNTSMNINGSGNGLLRNQVYHLTVEAINAVGSTHSEEILLCKSIIATITLSSVRDSMHNKLANVPKEIP